MELKKKGFQMPDKIYFEEETLTDTYGKLLAGPLQKGFGTTLGNSLRRVLLSSIEGAAVTSIRIPGLLHEFTAIPGVKEDAVDIVLNVKRLRFRLSGDKPRVVTINAKGPGEVRAKDISTDGFVKVLNEDQYILTLDKDMDFSMEITVAKGMGYRPAEENKSEDQPIDVLPIDSIFTPIKKVNFWVEAARVGQATDYDRLIMEIWTDGSITPPQAVTEAANILIDYLLLFSLEEDEMQGSGEDVEEEKKEDEEDNQVQDVPFNKNLLKRVDELELSVRAFNCLKNANINTIAELVQKTENEMLNTKNFGRKSLVEIKRILNDMGLHFGMKIDQEQLEAMRKELATSDDEYIQGLGEEVESIGGEHAS